MNNEAVTVVETWNLGKTYRTGFWLNQKVVSLQDCSLRVDQGETFGLLGPNGAGKTTLLKTLLGIIRPTSGRGVLLGRPLGDRLIKQRVGYLPENAYYYDYLTGWEFLSFVAGLFKIPPKETKKRIIRLLDVVGLAEATAKKKQLRQYSKGMVQRIGMAQALINDPEVVFLDEPMSGLDPMGRYQVRQIILNLKAQGKTIFFNSHILADVEKICDRIAILAQGNLICSGSLDELLGSPDHYQVIVKGGTEAELSPWLDYLNLENQSWHGQLTKPPGAFIHYLESINAQLIDLKLARRSLEDFFLQQLEARGIYKSS
ncbi:ABC transporter ATP-binding protein [Gloeocapsa sp. PCC 73106]|uniref:ABC transporter ATP-binding protein n=1 Tax=Gloeocapsa sp. PCC 73106 TaxID=102232 RepID=UPI0002ABFA41|nr:ABC transporter ATP-binding protein [Gloeocapsa sp. PCC 73106]ELR97280.1 ABC-type multidrug transport system, ATPase component [Gloeocapsa sp. PCC 73106]